MAIEGNGFFVVENASGQTYLTRAGSFAPDASGNLVNASGYTLMGYPISSGSSQPASYSLDQLQPVQISISGLSPPVASTSGTLTGNLDSGCVRRLWNAACGEQRQLHLYVDDSGYCL